MASLGRRSRVTWAQRQELHHVLHFVRQPCTTPEEHMLKTAIRCFLNGEDAKKVLEQKVPPFVAERIANKARVWLGNERSQRRVRSKEIIEQRDRLKNANTFTSGNLRVTMGYSENRNYHMVNVTIYSVVQVWEEGENEVPEREYLINFSDFKTKEWLSKMMVWALMNSREILMKPASQAEMDTMRMFIPKDKVPA